MQTHGRQNKTKARSAGLADPPARRSQEERSTATKALILEAATGILFSQGYAAATVQLVAAQAGVSRGAMLHHFPSKADLLGAVVDAAHEADLVYLRKHVGMIANPVDRLKALPRLTWHVLSGPSGIAVLEIMLGSRSDPTLAEMLEPLQSRIEAESKERLGQMMREAGMRVNAEALEVIRVIVAAIRGLVIEMMFRRSGSEVPAAIHVFETLIDTLLVPQKAAASSLNTPPSRAATSRPAGRALGSKANAGRVNSRVE